MTSKKQQKELERYLKAEKARQQRILESHKEGEEWRNRSSSYNSPKTNLNLSSKQADNWATKKTQMSPNQGKSNDKKAGRTLGRYIKGKI